MRSPSNAATTPTNLMAEADKIYGKFLPETIDPPERVCFVIEIPDTLQYRAALMGQLEWLADWRCWEHTQADYNMPPARNLEAAQLFAIAVTDGRFDECGVMSCDDVQDCIETDAGVQSAIQGMINQSDAFPAEYPYGQNLPSSATTRDIAAGTNPGCDLDILWSQCLGIVQNTNLAIVDVLQKVEVSSNVVELANSLVQSVPLLGTAKDVLGISGAIDMINYYQEAVLEGYSAQYTETPGGVRDQLACAIFCACKADCQITIDRVVGVLQERLSVYVAPPSLEGFVNFVETLAGINQDTTFVVDLAFFTAWGLIKVANFFFGQRFNDTLDVIVALMADEPNNDWEILCEDCPEPEAWQVDIDFTGGSMPAGWTVAAGTFTPGSGVRGTEPLGGSFYCRVQYDPVDIEQITEFVIQTTGYAVNDFGQIFSPTSGAAYTYNFDTQASPGTDVSATGLPVDFSADPLHTGFVWVGDNTKYLTGLHIEGVGENPYE